MLTNYKEKNLNLVISVCWFLQYMEMQSEEILKRFIISYKDNNDIGLLSVYDKVLLNQVYMSF